MIDLASRPAAVNPPASRAASLAAGALRDTGVEGIDLRLGESLNTDTVGTPVLRAASLGEAA